EVRDQLAAIGVASLRELLGRSDALRPARRHRALMSGRGIDLSRLLEGARAAVGEPLPAVREGFGALERRILADVLPRLMRGEAVEASYPITSSDRAVLARLSGELAERAHAERMKSLRMRPHDIDAPDRRCYLPEPGTVRLEFEGSAGQGFACFLVRGVEARLSGEANDAVAKGMSGGSVTIVPARRARFVAEGTVLIGNGALYGATGGALYLRGTAGDR